MSRFGIFLLIGSLVLILILLGFLRRLPNSSAHKPAAETARVALGGGGAAVQPGTTGAGSGAAASAKATTADEQARAALVENVRQALAVLNDPANPNKAQALAALRDALRAAEPTVAIGAIRQFLATGEDAKTGQGFKVGSGGTLEETPSLRTFLMDQLGTVARGIGSQEAAAEARTTLATHGSADEWAVAMRNLGWTDPEGSRAVLAGKARELLNDPNWKQSPTGGYLEAFDSIPYSGDASLVAELVPLATTRSGTQQAALVALQRLSALAPGQMAAYLNDTPGVLADKPGLRADYMGSLDLTQPGQLNQAETYLSRSDVADTEKTKFLERLGTPAQFVSNNLLTPSHAATMDLADHRAMANTQASAWLTANKYPQLQTALQALVEQTKEP